MKAEQSWKAAQGQLQLEMPMAAFDGVADVGQAGFLGCASAPASTHRRSNNKYRAGAATPLSVHEGRRLRCRVQSPTRRTTWVSVALPG